MGRLSELPNVGKVLEANLLLAGIKTPEELKSIGAEEAFLRILAHADSTACLHMLYGIQGAIENIPDKYLAQNTKEKLKIFYKSLKK